MTKTKFSLTALSLLICAVAFGAVTTFDSFDPTYFQSNNFKITLRSGAAGQSNAIANLNGTGTNTILKGTTVLDTAVATNLIGNGSGLTNLNATQLSSGTVPVAQMPALGAAYPNALSNNQSTAVNLAKAPFTVTPPATFGVFSIGDSTGVGAYNFSEGVFLKGNGGGINGKDNVPAYATWDAAGNFVFGVPTGTNFFTASRAAMSAGMMTNINPPFDAVAHVGMVPELWVNSYDAMGCAPNGAFFTNTIALLDTVAPGWFAMGWSNVWGDCGMLTNRVGAANHITNNGTAFPQGITGIVTYAHSHGFKIGAYLAHSQAYCAGGPGVPTIDSFIFQDVYDVGAMGFDALKVDFCGNSTNYTDGLSYGPGDTTMLTRHYAMFAEANYFMSYKLGRKPLFMETTEVSSITSSSWTPYNTTAAYNAYENGSPPGGNGWQGVLTNWLFEMPNFYATRPGHFLRIAEFTGATAVDARGSMTLAALGPCSVFLANTNLIGNATASPFYTNSLVNFGILKHPLVLPGYEVISNSANHTVVIARPLGPLNGRPTTAQSFNGGNFGIGLGGYITFGTDGTNAVGVFNLDTSAHTQVINVNNIGISSNATVSVYDAWNGGLTATFTNQWTTPSIPAGDTAFYLFVPGILIQNDFNVSSPQKDVNIAQTGDVNGGSAFHIMNRNAVPGAQIEQTSAPFGNLVGIAFKTFDGQNQFLLAERRSSQWGNPSQGFSEIQFWNANGANFLAYFGDVGSGVKGTFGVGGLETLTNGVALLTNAVSTWPTAPSTRGGCVFVNSNSFVYLLQSDPAGLTWTSTNKIGK